VRAENLAEISRPRTCRKNAPTDKNDLARGAVEEQGDQLPKTPLGSVSCDG
jgi:hypothetical protein